MRDGKPETPGEKFGYYVLGPLAVGVVIVLVCVGMGILVSRVLVP
ncbi:membrane protein [Microbacterium phage TurboVicky]|nr:membrane protein [Microbacterium phage TurboVicky]